MISYDLYTCIYNCLLDFNVYICININIYEYTRETDRQTETERILVFEWHINLRGLMITIKPSLPKYLENILGKAGYPGKNRDLIDHSTVEIG